jgi:hypothetical protein
MGTHASVLILSTIAACMTGCGPLNTKRLSVAEYHDKVYASWLGQCVGNMFGIPHEFQYNDEPRTEPIDGWADRALERIRDANGAFSDDDTDIEYVDLYLMEKHGVEPTYENVAEFWKLCINRSIWVANESARKLMDQGYLPPLTGRKGINPNWFKIDPQLVCEVWAVTAPGMLDYAAAKADWAAKVTNDDYGTHPTIWYNVMYAAAFFETDVEKLCQIGYEHVPEGSPFRTAIDDVRTWKAEHGSDWVAVRKKIKEKYVDHVGLDQDIATDPVGALLNGTLGVLALLYGEGDFEKTLHLACMAGYDADNQAATLSGLIALSRGSDCIPDNYLYILDGWDKPLNDFYKNKTRDELPDSTITDIATRTADLGIQVVELHGGSVSGKGDRATLVINTDAKFVAPVEARLVPHRLILDAPVTVQTETIGGDPDKPHTILITGPIPPGLSVQSEHGRVVLKGTPTTIGRYDIVVTLTRGEFERETTIPVFVNARDLARSAGNILAAVTEPTGGGSRKLNVIRQEMSNTHYDSYDGDNELAEDYYGYEWKQPVKVSRVVYETGPVFDNGGWFKTLTVQYRNADGHWLEVKNLKWNPPHAIELNKRDHTRFTATFDPVETTGVRIAGAPGGTARFTSIRQLDVYER